MDCDETRPILGAFHDGELGRDERAQVRAHLESCTACSRELDAIAKLGTVLQSSRAPLPAALADRVRAGLQAAADASDTSGDIDERGRLAWLARWTEHGRLSQVAALLLIAVVSSTLGGVLTWHVLRQQQEGSILEHDVLAAHIRSAVQGSSVQVASSDSHNVKPWFLGRVEFAPAVRDLTSDGFPLAGARLDYVGGRRVGVIVYHRELHVIDVFAWPAADATDAPPEARSARGFNILAWTRNGVAYWAVSDLNMAELRELQALL